MMDVLEAIEKRTSIRSFREEQLKGGDLEAILHAAERCPRIGSLDILVLQNGEIIQRLSDAAKRGMIASGGWNKSRAQTGGYSPLYGAPTAIMLCGRPEQPFLQLTIGIAVGMMILTATALGLGSVTVSSTRHGFGGPEGQELNKLLGLNDGQQVILTLAVGYTNDPHAHEMKGAAPNNVRYIR
jgi:nitroreductase